MTELIKTHERKITELITFTSILLPAIHDKIYLLQGRSFVL